MSYCRKNGSSDVYVYKADHDKYICHECHITYRQRNYSTTSPAKMAKHLLEHRADGDMVEQDAIDRLRKEAVQ